MKATNIRPILSLLPQQTELTSASTFSEREWENERGVAETHVQGLQQKVSGEVAARQRTRPERN